MLRSWHLELLQRVKRASPQNARLGWNFSWSLVGHTFYAVCQWAMLILLAKLGTPELVGQYSLGLALTAPIVLGASLQLRTAQATDAKREYEFNDYLVLRVITSAVALILTFIVAFVGNYSTTTALVIALVGVSKTVEAVSDVTYGLFQQRERMDFEAKSMILRGGLGLALTGVALLVTHSILWFCGALVAAWLLVLVVHDIPIALQLLDTRDSDLTSTNVGALTRLVRLTLPLGVVSLLISLSGNIPRYFVEQQMGTEALGIYSALAYITVAGNMVIEALVQSATPRLARFTADRQLGQFRHLLGLLGLVSLGIGGCGVIVAIFLGPQLLAIIYTADYAKHNAAFIWLLVAATVSYAASVLNHGMNAARQFKPQMLLFVLVAASVSLAGHVLIPSLGLIGAALAYAAGMLTQALGAGVILRMAFAKTRVEP